jgi:hypothetical protein
VGTYIYTSAEVRKKAGWKASKKEVFTCDPDWPGMNGARFTARPFYNQNSVLFALLVGRKDIPGIVPLGDYRSLPEDSTPESVDELVGQYEYRRCDDPDEVLTVDQRIRGRYDLDRGGFSWIGADELMAIDYDQLVPDYGQPAQLIPLSDALGDMYMSHLKKLSRLGSPENVRILFCFDG